MQIRQSIIEDMVRIADFDHLAKLDRDRLPEIRRAIGQNECWSITEDENVVGYVIINHEFFHRRFLCLIYIDENYRGKGMGRQAIKWCKETIRKPFFVSTNLSNARMIHLLRSEGFEDSGIIYNLDPGDPEVVFIYREGAGV